MEYYNKYVEKIISVIKDDHSKGLDCLIKDDIAMILIEMTDEKCRQCEYFEYYYKKENE